MTGRFARWLELPTGERWLLLGMMAGLLTISASLRLFGVVRTRRWLEQFSRNVAPRAADAGELQSAQRLTQLADIAGRRGAITATCLRQSLLIYWLLRRRGLAPELKIGVRKEQAKFDAHAWIELQGVALGQADLAHSPFLDRAWSAPAPLL